MPPALPTVLLVAIDAAVGDEMAAALAGHGYEVVPVRSRAEVPPSAPDAPVAAVVGAAVPRRELASFEMPVVAVVGAGDAEVDDAMEAGAHDVLRLPLDPSEVVARVRAAARVAALRDEVRAISRTDALTGLWNRRHLDEHLGMVASMAKRLRKPFSLLMVDIDRTRRINEEYGTAAGDAVVAEVARRVAAGLRGEDLAGRWSGEEFVVLLPHTPLDGAWRLADRIRGSVCDVPIALGSGRDVVVTVSIGCAEGYGDDRHDHLRRVHEALDEAKQAGRNRVVAGI